jgi:hypothetical protein
VKISEAAIPMKQHLPSGPEPAVRRTDRDSEADSAVQRIWQFIRYGRYAILILGLAIGAVTLIKKYQTANEVWRKLDAIAADPNPKVEPFPPNKDVPTFQDLQKKLTTGGANN